MPLFDGIWKIRKRSTPPTRAVPMEIEADAWTVFFETPEAFGAIGWRLTLAEAEILAHKIELGVQVV